MSSHHASYEFRALQIAVATISDSRTLETDTSGQSLVEKLETAGHHLAQRRIILDNVHQIRGVVARWIADANIQVIITTGGSGLTGRDVTPEALLCLFDKQIDGFGELFRAISYKEIGTSTLQSRAFAGIANGTVIFCVPGSTGACRTAWDEVISHQIDGRTKPCNLAQLLPRLTEV